MSEVYLDFSDVNAIKDNYGGSGVKKIKYLYGDYTTSPDKKEYIKNNGNLITEKKIKIQRQEQGKDIVVSFYIEDEAENYVVSKVIVDQKVLAEAGM